jgi:hypothetical protein
MSLEDKLLNGGSQFTRYEGKNPTLNELTVNSSANGTIDFITGGSISRSGISSLSLLHRTYSINDLPSLPPNSPSLYLQTPDSQLPIPSGLDDQITNEYTTHYRNGEKLNSRYHERNPLNGTGFEARAQGTEF